jgi:hypothetical protein
MRKGSGFFGIAIVSLLCLSSGNGYANHQRGGFYVFSGDSFVNDNQDLRIYQGDYGRPYNRQDYYGRQFNRQGYSGRQYHPQRYYGRHNYRRGYYYRHHRYHHGYHHHRAPHGSQGGHHRGHH